MHLTTPLENLGSCKETGARHTNKDNDVLDMIKNPRVVRYMRTSKTDVKYATKTTATTGQWVRAWQVRRREIRSINPQAASTNTVVSSESALATTMPVLPNGTNWRCAEFDPPVGVGREPVNFAVPTGPGVPEEPPAAAESCAKPTEGGWARKTLYTFLRNVSPTIHSGVPAAWPGPVPSSISKIAPRHWLLPAPTVPRFRSSMLIGHEGPPNEIETVT